MTKSIGFLVCALAVAGSANAGVPNSKALERFDETAETVKCVDMRSTDITAVDETTFIFKAGPNDYYLNRTRGACNGASSSFTRYEINLFGSRLCSGEIMKIVDQQSGIFRGACSLGDFTKLNRKPAAPAEE